MADSRKHRETVVTVTCFDPEVRALMSETLDEYRRFRGLPDDPDNVYQFAYWLFRYSGLSFTKEVPSYEAVEGKDG